ncbi:glucose-1-phosphatase [Phthorimaea operculella]|nr:glucose-1-phosphatase [Phthorimaea operculella]
MKGDILKATAHKDWLDWGVPVSTLTEKGALLETYMAKYFIQWLEKEGLQFGCKENEAVIYANDRQRTIETAKRFAKAAFKNCNVTTQVEEKYFFPIVPVEESFRKKVDAQIDNELKEIDLDGAYRMLDKILDIKNSELCKEEILCDLTEKNKSKVIYKPNHQMYVDGPLNVAFSAVDAFIMAYYEGVPIEKIAWGKIKEEDLAKLAKITRSFIHVVFNGTICPHHCTPLLKKMSEVFENKTIKYAFFFGHDVIQRAVMCQLGFKHSVLPNTWEDNPIGSKIVFQKWYDEENDRYLLKIEYVYPSNAQLRDGSEVSLESPPESVEMELADCPIDGDGFCLWTEFLEILNMLQL